MTELALAVFASETGTHLLRPPLNPRWSSHLRNFDATAYEQRLAARGFRFLPRTAPEFPPLLRAIHDPPPGLFLRGSGEIGLLSQAAVAVVGARACSGYGTSVARSLGRERRRDLAGDREHLAPFVEREVGSDERAAPLARFDDDRRSAEPRNDSVARGKPPRRGLDARRVFGDEQAVRSDATSELGVSCGIVAVDAAPEHGDGRAVGFERASVRFGVDTARHA